MFNQKIIERLNKSNRNNMNLLGEPHMLGGIRERTHPLAEMAFDSDSLATGAPIKTRLVGGLHTVTRGGSIKSIGKVLKKGVKQVGKVVLKDVIQPVASKYARDQLTKFITKEALPVAEEVAPLVLMAAGRSGGSRSARAALVKKIMSEQGLSLPMASKHIKENNLKY